MKNRSIDRGENKLGNNNMVTMPQHCRDGSRHGNNYEISSRSRRAAADADLPHLRRLSTASSNSDSTDVSTSNVDTNKKIGGQQQRRRPSRQEDFNRLSATCTRRHSSPGSELHAIEPFTSSQSKGKSGGNEAGRGRADNNRPSSSTSYTRRHSYSPGSERRAIEPSSTSSQSKSGGSNEAAAIRRRRKCQPHHRSASMNEGLSSILKPSKYSPSSSFTSEGSDSTASTNAATTTAKKPPRQRFLRRWSAPSIGSEEGLPTSSMHSFFLPPPEKTSNKKSHRRSSSDDDLDKWVADGVDFCSNVEVHLFRS